MTLLGPRVALPPLRQLGELRQLRRWGMSGPKKKKKRSRRMWNVKGNLLCRGVFMAIYICVWI